MNELFAGMWFVFLTVLSIAFLNNKDPSRRRGPPRRASDQTPMLRRTPDGV